MLIRLWVYKYVIHQIDLVSHELDFNYLLDRSCVVRLYIRIIRHTLMIDIERSGRCMSGFFLNINLSSSSCMSRLSTVKRDRVLLCYRPHVVLYFWNGKVNLHCTQWLFLCLKSTQRKHSNENTDAMYTFHYNLSVHPKPLWLLLPLVYAPICRLQYNTASVMLWDLVPDSTTFHDSSRNNANRIWNFHIK